jgi:phosphotransferase system enzyme I (PtsP)
LVHRYYDPLHPAMLHAIDQMVQVAKGTGRGLCICGEMASDPGCFALLVGLGLREFSVSAPSILPLKALLAQFHSEELVQLAQQALEHDHGDATRELVNQLLQRVP